ncbi:hypothetical protein [Sinorhizobium sp. BG8]|uniref:hypothetical protein n=1 Tax=Sinorhizobium sp. BG8 TaxID=2613773 RepID=UPI00193DA2FA|nr:hypothetical protein [Sinorhizobium sp. BG8]QRM56237.1 hypothetical protein F3Y30_18105 [Sinorhizobium sp. BG8]
MKNPEVEGRLNAHRRLFVSLFSVLAHLPEARSAILAFARDAEVVADHEEDPGMDPDATFAVQQIADDEIRAILGAAIRRFEAEPGASGG